MVVAAPASETLAGYRVLRRLGSGSRSDVFLAAGEHGSVAIKAFSAAVDRESIGHELDALGRLDSPHLARLVDLANDADGRPLLVLERVQRGSVGAWLAARDSVEPGEAVTLLAPLTRAVVELHSAGVGHGSIGAASVHLGARGEPVVLGFGHCELFARDGSPAALTVEPRAAKDRDDLAELAIAVLDRVRTASGNTRAHRLIEWIRTTPREFEFLEALEGRLFDFADPMPVRFGAQNVEARELPARIGRHQRVDMVPEASDADSPVDSGIRSESLLHRVDALLRNNPISAIRMRAAKLVRSIRKPFWIAAAAVVAALVLALTVLPQGSSGAQPAATDSPTAPTTHATAPILPDDPVLALPLLLVTRTACVRELSVQCLETVDDANSGAYASDAALVEQLQGGTEIPKSAIVSATRPRLIEILGNSAIVALGNTSGPVSVLMIKTPDGWRIRSYLSGVQATASPAPSS